MAFGLWKGLDGIDGSLYKVRTYSIHIRTVTHLPMQDMLQSEGLKSQPLCDLSSMSGYLGGWFVSTVDRYAGSLADVLIGSWGWVIG